MTASQKHKQALVEIARLQSKIRRALRAVNKPPTLDDPETLIAALDEVEHILKGD